MQRLLLSLASLRRHSKQKELMVKVKSLGQPELMKADRKGAGSTAALIILRRWITMDEPGVINNIVARLFISFQ
eukprot:10535255-Ditylum_brightwellii.AAC.1